MSVNLKLSPTAKVIAAREAQNFLDEVNGVTAVVIATVDGFDVASAMRAGDAARVAAMASSISAISSVVPSSESRKERAVVGSSPTSAARPTSTSGSATFRPCVK